VDNPFLGARGYVNPEWRAQADQIPGGSKISNNSTSVWIDTVALAIGSLDGRRGLRGHLETALEQGAGYVQVVIDNLPGKNCDQLPGTEFQPDEVNEYQREFIDPIAAIEADPRYQSLRIINIVERRWVQNLVINTGARAGASPRCDAVAEAGSYVAGVRYALTKLRRAGANVYTYLDAGAYYELGWRDNFLSAVALIADTVRGTPDGFASVDGFATNLGGYAPLTEPHFTMDTQVNGVSVRQSRWVDWNSYVDALPYAAQLRLALMAAGFNSSIGMVIDTSRNGWGGMARPARASTSRDLDTFVDESRVDRRPYASSWCNQSGAGLGERPVAAPRPGIDAYAWIKVPGESDGVSPRPGIPMKAGDWMCDPSYVAEYGYSRPTGAMAGAPYQGRWFPEAFTELLTNAYPPLP
jgi:cellulose 1,4-beta-cellobiosidase